MLVISVDLSVGGIESAIRQINAYTNDLENKSKELTQKLADIGNEEAIMRFASARYDGTNDVKCSVHSIKGGHRISARGKSVEFIEYGTGVTYEQPYPMSKPPHIVPIGTYGKGNGKHKAWVYKGEAGTNGSPFTNRPNYVLTYGNPPNMCMYYASKKIEENIEKVGKEVFK